MFLAKLAHAARRLAHPSAGPPMDGAVEELSPDHVAGWIRDPADPARRVAYDIVDRQSGRVLARGVADQFRHYLNRHDVGDAAHGFHARLAMPQGGVLVRPQGGAGALPMAASPRTHFEPLLHVAMDIVDNCNLRCPFCIYDYANTNVTHFMTERTLGRALRFLPYVRDGQFWFSCLHEPTLHPQLMAFVDSVPRAYRRKVFYTTNLAKRMPDSYFAWLANSGLHNLNISIESRDPAIYERMRKGARFRIFQDNWDRLLAAFAQVPEPPLLRYIAMAYKSNVDELPALASYLLEERRAWQVELRYTFDTPSIPAAFRASEFLDAADWVRLRARLPAYPIEKLLLLAPAAPVAPAPVLAAGPAPAPAPVTSCLPDYYMVRLLWDGTLRASGVSPDSRRGNAIERDILSANVDDIDDVRAFLDSLSRHACA